MADDNMIDETTQPTENQENQESDEFEDDDDITEDGDFNSLNLQLDQLSSALDALEQKNDHIQAQLMKLLESNRETRQQFQESMANENKSGSQGDCTD